MRSSHSTGSVRSVSSASTVIDPLAADCYNREIGDWISSFDFAETQRVILQSRSPNTGLRPLQSEDYTRWRQGEFKMLLISGLPGTGKASIVQDLKEYYEKSNVAVFCIFCDFALAQTQNAHTLLAAILRQLVQAHPVLHPSISSMYNHHSTQMTSPAFSEIITSLAASIGQFDRVFVVVDALDECLDDQTRSRLVSALSTLPVSLLLTSRPHPSIDQFLDGCTRQDVLADQHDLWTYCETRFSLSRIGRICSPESKQEILNHIVRKAGEMFVVARLLMDGLMEAPNVQEALKAVRDMPAGVQGTYDKALQHIREGSDLESKELALHALLLVTFSRRVLAFSELQEAIGTMFKLELEDPNRPFIDGNLTKQSLVGACAGLLTVEDKTDSVRLIHYTTHEYLVQEQESIWNNVQLKMAAVCVSYLRQVLKELPHNPDVYVEEELRNAVAQHPFFDYALREWGHHVHDCGELKVVDEVLEVLESDIHRTLGRLLTYNAMSSPKCTTWSVWHFCAYFNLSSTCLGMLQQKETPTHKKSSFPNLFFFRRGRRRTAPKSNLSLDERDDYEKTPLMVAASRGNVDMIRTLLGRDIDVEAS
ncbi:hypothetical protein EV360DRAFT_78191 [Lentinula raphanica]|nr:hypothetical protein EV360DRAFT_78191 [Lentinula raphanica]